MLGPDSGQDFHVNARALLGALRKYCHSQKSKDFSLLQDLPTLAPDLARDLPHAIETNGDVLVPFDTFAGHFAGRMDNLLQFAKPAPGMPSHAEVQALLKGEPNPAENHGNTGAESWGNTHPPLPPEQVEVPGGGLRAHEAIGGHVLEKHVGKAEPELLGRYKSEPKITASSSFYNEATAEEAIAAALKEHDAEIRTWIASGYKGKRPEIDYNMNKSIGISIPKDTKVAQPAHNVHVEIRPDQHSPLGYYILTGFPTL
jgi:hypothetical protein